MKELNQTTPTKVLLGPDDLVPDIQVQKSQIVQEQFTVELG